MPSQETLPQETAPRENPAPATIGALTPDNGYDAYDYAILRVVPRVERGEFINAGVVLSCPRHRYLEARYEVDAARLRALDPSVDLLAVEAHLAAIARVCQGGEEAGPLGKLSQRERFHWLVAPRSALIQTSPAHTGRCRGGDPAAVLERLLERMVRTPRPQPESLGANDQDASVTETVIAREIFPRP